MIPSYNVRATVDFFKDVFEFTSLRDEDDMYVILIKDNLTIHIQRAGDIGEMSFYMEVDDIDALWASAETKLIGINARAPFNRDYGMREFHVIVPHTKTLLFVGQGIR